LEQTPTEEETLSTDETENDTELLKSLSEELGTIPEVGINIMPFMFFGCVVSCSVIMYQVKKSVKVD
jgi:hypothetical protein